MWQAQLFAPFLLTHDADERDAYDKREGKHTFADFCLFFCLFFADKYLTDPYINSRDVYPIFPFCEQLSIFFFAKLLLFKLVFFFFCANAGGLIFYFAFETLLKYLLQVHFRMCSIKTCVYFLQVRERGMDG